MVAPSLARVVKVDVEAVGKMLDGLLEVRSPYEDLEPDYEFMPAPWCGCSCH